MYFKTENKIVKIGTRREKLDPGRVRFSFSTFQAILERYPGARVEIHSMFSIFLITLLLVLSEADITAEYTRGRNLFEQGRFTEAEEVWKRLIKLAPEFETVGHLDLIYLTFF